MAAQLPSGATTFWPLLVRVLARALASSLAVGVLMHGAVPTEFDYLPVAFSAEGNGLAGALAASLPRASAPAGDANGTEVTLSWTAATFPGGDPIPEYVVRRYDTSGIAQTVLTDCAGVVSALSCAEAGVASGTWQYTVQAVVGDWAGQESPLSAQVTVSSSTLDFTSSTTITVLPATMSGTISGFVEGESLTYRLDSATGPVLSGTPSTVPAGGTGSISVTIPPGTSDTVHSVFVVGGSGTVASAAFRIVDPPDLVSLEAFDINGNGRVDRVVATFDEPLASDSAGIAPWDLGAVPSGGFLEEVVVSGSTATLHLTEGPGAATTALGAFTVALAEDSGGIRDQYGNRSSFAATPPVDRAAPALLALSLRDFNTNGKVDYVTATFSETPAAYSAGIGPWTVANVPSGGTLATVSISGSTAILALTEGTGVHDTAVGAMTVALAANATGIRDAAGNLAAFAATAPVDLAGPVPMTISDSNGTLDGSMQPGDTLVITFSEPLSPDSVPTTTAVTLTDPKGNQNDNLAITGITDGTRSTGSNGYLLSDSTTASFADSTVTLSNGNRTVTVTVGATCTGTGCASLGQVTTAANFDYVPAATLLDATGNAAAGSRSTSMRLF